MLPGRAAQLKAIPKAESAQLYPAAKMSDWIFYQEKSNFADV
jgi:hypothetical protein